MGKIKHYISVFNNKYRSNVIALLSFVVFVLPVLSNQFFTQMAYNVNIELSKQLNNIVALMQLRFSISINLVQLWAQLVGFGAIATFSYFFVKGVASEKNNSDKKNTTKTNIKDSTATIVGCDIFRLNSRFVC